MDIEFEIRDLKRRVGDLEGAVSVLAGRVQAASPELEALRHQSGSRFDSIDTQMKQVVTRLDTLNSQTWSLRDDLPALIAEALARAGRRDDDTKH